MCYVVCMLAGLICSSLVSEWLVRRQLVKAACSPFGEDTVATIVRIAVQKCLALSGVVYGWYAAPQLLLSLLHAYIQRQGLMDNGLIDIPEHNVHHIWPVTLPRLAVPLDHCS